MDSELHYITQPLYKEKKDDIDERGKNEGLVQWTAYFCPVNTKELEKIKFIEYIIESEEQKEIVTVEESVGAFSITRRGKKNVTLQARVYYKKMKKYTKEETCVIMLDPPLEKQYDLEENPDYSILVQALDTDIKKWNDYFLQKNGRFFDFRGADLSGKNLSNADLRGINFFNADFHGARMQGTRLSGALLMRANFNGCDLDGADLEGADLREAKFRKTTMCNSKGLNANFSGADFTDADLKHADLRGVDLTKTVLWGAILENTNLVGADLRDSQTLGLSLGAIQEEKNESLIDVTETEKLPLSIQIVYHPDSVKAAEYASEIFFTFMQSSEPGFRIPVFYGPLKNEYMPGTIDLDKAVHTLVIILVDENMARRVGERVSYEEWGEYIRNNLKTIHYPHRILPIALDPQAFTLNEDLDYISFIRLDINIPEEQKKENLMFLVAVNALDIMRKERQKPVELFISHAKKNLPSDPNALAEGPVRSILSFIAQNPIASWYDAKEIPAGGRFDNEISSGILRCSAMICFNTDDYASREWCRREILEAKTARRPIIMVDALTNKVPRTFPYSGNVPAIRWTDSPSTPVKIIHLALTEALRYENSIALLNRQKKEDDVILGTAPEIMTLANLPSTTIRVLYPDPPIGNEELERVKAFIKNITFETPLTHMISSMELSENKKNLIGLSLSNAPDGRKYGSSNEHLAIASHDLALYLLYAGFSLGYGGMIGFPGAGKNYLIHLFNLFKSYSPYAKKQGHDFNPIINYVGWPIYIDYTNKEDNQYGDWAKMEKVGKPDLGCISLKDIAGEEPHFFPPDTPERRFAWSLGMTAMRKQMTEDVCARIVMGGKLTGYSGIYAGVLEEILLSIEAHQPVYLIGAFGGAARMVIDSIEKNERKEMAEKWLLSNDKDYKQIKQLYEKSHFSFYKLEALSTEMMDSGSQCLNNGLSPEENRELFYTQDSFVMVKLILKGLLAKLNETQQP